MTNGDALQMLNGLNAVKQPLFADIKHMEDMTDYLFHAKFIQAVSYNKRKLNPLIESFQDIEKFSDEYNAYLKERDEILSKYAKKDKEGNPVKTGKRIGEFIQEAYNIPSLADKNSIASKAIKKLEDNNKALIDERKEKSKEIEALLKEDCKVPLKFKLVPWSMIPKGLDTSMMDGVMYMIEEEEVGKLDVIKKKEDTKKDKT